MTMIHKGQFSQITQFSPKFQCIPIGKGGKQSKRCMKVKRYSNILLYRRKGCIVRVLGDIDKAKPKMEYSNCIPELWKVF